MKGNPHEEVVKPKVHRLPFKPHLEASNIILKIKVFLLSESI